MGQPGAGPSMGAGKLSMTSGFWNLPARVQVAVASTAVAVTISSDRAAVPSAAVADAPKSLAPAVTQETENLVVSWPVDAVGLTLESTTDLGAEGQWTVVGDLLPTTEGLQRVRVPFSGAQRFFRLRVAADR